MRTSPFLMLSVAFLIFAAACDPDAKKDKQEELTIVVEADRSKLAAAEKDLQSKMEGFRQEQERLEKERNSLLGSDKASGKRLSEIDKKLQQMLTKESELNKERQKLSRQKDELLSKVAGKGEAGDPANLARREGSLAGRERSLANREADVAKREADVARREAELSRREADFLKTKSNLASLRAPVMPATYPRSTKVSHKKAESAYKSSMSRMRSRGILIGDLPLESANLIKEIRAAKKEGDFGRLMDLVEQLNAIVKNTKVNADFIDRKFQRLAQLNKERPPSAKDKQTVSNLLRKATQLYSDGKFGLANKELNRIFGLLTR